MFVGWGRQPDFSEYTPTGKQIFNASFPLGVDTYRAFRFKWRGIPVWRPVLAASRQKNGTTKVWASWNGATQVAGWRALGGPGPGKLKALASASRSGFETSLVIHSQPAFVPVQALSARGKILRTSGAQPTGNQGGTAAPSG
jgi:hypothetical protein